MILHGGGFDAAGLSFRLVDELRWALLTRVPTLARRSMCAPLLDQSGAAIEEAFDEIIRLARKPGAGAAFRQLQRSEYRWRGLRTNYLDRLSEIQVPTLIVHGAEDRLFPSPVLNWLITLFRTRNSRLWPGVAIYRR